MKYLELTFADPAANLACDEALLELFEADARDENLLRILQPEKFFVVLGHANRSAEEVDLAVCAAGRIPILRRVSGGGTVLQGPGCLNYSLILNCKALEVRSIASTFRYVLEHHRNWIERSVGVKVSVEGGSDLAIAGRKFSGNAQYRKSRYALVHGSFLLNFDLAFIHRCLRLPVKQPAYRHNRPHLEFVTNLDLRGGRLGDILREGWGADQAFNDLPMAEVKLLVKNRYGREEWSKKF